MSQVCPVCDAENTEVQAKYRAFSQYFANINRSQCPSCRLTYASPMPSDQNLKSYNSRYYESAYGGHAAHKTARANFSAIALLRTAHIQSYLSKRKVKVSSILELGPGMGYFARHWLESEQVPAYYAVETDSSCHA
jgi:hypothetical protein